MTKRLLRAAPVSATVRVPRLLMALTCLLAAVFSVSCGNDLKSQDFDAETGASVKRGVKPEPDAEVAVVETDFGKMVIELYPNIAPKMVERFKQLTREGFYDGTTFHRIDPEAGVIQGGDPLSKDNDMMNDGTGSSPYPNVPAEFSDVPFERGIVGAARTNDPNTANCQFYVTLQRVPMWDEKYTVFGRVIQGMGVANIISTAPVTRGTHPDPPIVIRRITLQPRSGFAS